MSTHHPTEGNTAMTHQTDRRRVADVLIVMRRTLIRKTIAELSGDHAAVARHERIMDNLATDLPLRLRTTHALHQYVGYPAQRTIERYGILALVESGGYRPC